MNARNAIDMARNRAADALDRTEIERRAYQACHKDYIGLLDGRPAMLWLNPNTGGTELALVSQIPTEYLIRMLV